MKHLLAIIFILYASGTLFAAEYIYNSGQQGLLKTKINGGLQPGDVVYLEDGTYTDCLLVFKGNGTSDRPITLKARNQGKVIFTGKVRLQMSGVYLIVDGLVFKDGVASDTDIVEFRTSNAVFAYNCRLTNCVIDNCNDPTLNKNEEKPSERWVMLYGRNNRVDHCYFARKDRSGVLLMVALDKNESRNNDHQIDSNFFGYREKFPAGNGGEIIRLGDSGTSIYSCKTTIENNFFYHCDGESEIISIKSADNIIRRNTFYESAGSVVCRHGKNNTICSNVFIGNNKPNCGGVRVINEGQKVYDNFFQELAGTGSRSALCVMTAVFENPTSQTDIWKEPLNAYHRVKNVDIVHNTFVGCESIEIGTVGTYTYSDDNPYYPGKKVTGTLYPRNLKIADNIVYNPVSKTIWKDVSSASVNETSFEYNVCKFSSNFTHSGFVNYNLNYELQEGVFLLGNSERMPSPTNYDYVLTDITGTLRPLIQKNAGAQEPETLSDPFDAAKPNDCGTSWYANQQTEMNDALSRTVFFPARTSSVRNAIKDDDPVRIFRQDDQLVVSSIDIMNEFSLYNVNGQVLDIRYPHANVFYFETSSYPKGIYLCRVMFNEGRNFFRKIII